MFSYEVTDQDLVACGAKDSMAPMKMEMLMPIQNGDPAIEKGGGLYKYPWMDHNCFNNEIFQSFVGQLRQKNTI